MRVARPTCPVNALLEHIAARAAHRPDHVALTGRGAALTAARLDAAIHEFAAALRGARIERLGLLAENSPAWIIADLACQLAGCCAVPLPHFFSAPQIENCIGAAGLDAVLSDRAVPIASDSHTRALDLGDGVPMQLYRLRGHARPPLPAGTQKLTFTSGSTGDPRGVCLDTAQQLRVAGTLAEAIGTHEPRHLCVAPLSTLLENIGVYVALLTDGQVIALGDADIGLHGSSGLDIARLAQALQRHQPASLILAPQLLAGLVAAIEEGWSPPATLHFVAVGGGRVSPELIHAARAGGLPVYEGYGLSETASVACVNRPGADRPGSVGRPLQHVRVTIDAGEIVVRGNSMLGYLGGEPDECRNGVRTGDLGHIDGDGFVYVDGRRKHLLVSGFGRNINPEWPESLLLSRPLIAQCVVFGEARPWCVALLAPRDRACADDVIQAWVDEVNAALPDYARIGAWHRLERALTAADGLVTTNGRPRRARIERQFTAVIEQLYPAPAAVAAS